MKRETYPQARERLFRELRALNFEVKDKLKVPQVAIHGLYTGSDTKRTLFFHAQAVYLDDLSMFLDYRGMSADMLLAIVQETHKSRLKIGR
jgi:hypothetical protein